MGECEKQGTSSIAFPAIGTGNLKFPAATTAHIMVDEICDYLQKNKCKFLHNIYIMIYKDTAMCRAFSDELEKRKRMELVPMKKKRRLWFSRGQQATPLGVPPQPEYKTESVAKLGSSHSLEFENGLTMEIVKGDITLEKTDVIVNTTSQSLSLDAGVSLALVKRAGKVLQDACTAVDPLKKKGLNEGKVVETEAGNLNCKCVFHIRFQRHNFVKVVSSCIERARELKYTSIAFPAIGTGREKYPADAAAENMIKGIKQCSVSSQLHVRVVLFDEQVYSKFVQVLETKLTQPATAEVQTSSTSQFDAAYESETLTEYDTMTAEFEIRIFGETKEKVKAAEKCLCELIDKNFKREEVNDKIISLLTERQIRALEMEALTMQLMFQIYRGSNTIELEGNVNRIREIQLKIKDALSKVEKAENLMRSVQWKRQDSTGETSYELLWNFEIEENKEKTRHTFLDDVSGEHFTIDYKNRQEIDHALGDRTRPVKRVLMGKCKSL